MSDLIPRRKDLKLKQEWAHDACEKWKKLPDSDPRKEAAMDEMIHRAQKYGEDYRAYYRGEGRQYRWKKDGRWHG